MFTVLMVGCPESPQQAVWSVDLQTGKVKYVNENAKLFSWTPNY
jgi:hypothetical protein